MRLQRQGLRPRHPHGETRDSPAKPESSLGWGPAPNGPGHRRERATGILLAVAATPFAAVALVHCTKPAADPAAGPVDAAVATTAASSAPSSGDVAPPGSSASSTAVPSALIVDAAVASASAPKLATRAECLALAKAHADYIAAHQGCTNDGDCDQTNASCGLAAVCGAPINKAFKKGVVAKDDAFTGAGCMAVLAAPCPTCPFFGAPKCVSGKCTLVK